MTPPREILPGGRDSGESTQSRIFRWLKFNAVGAGGIVVQLVALTILTSALRSTTSSQPPSPLKPR